MDHHHKKILHAGTKKSMINHSIALDHDHSAGSQWKMYFLGEKATSCVGLGMFFEYLKSNLNILCVFTPGQRCTGI